MLLSKKLRWRYWAPPAVSKVQFVINDKILIKYCEKLWKQNKRFMIEKQNINIIFRNAKKQMKLKCRIIWKICSMRILCNKLNIKVGGCHKKEIFM